MDNTAHDDARAIEMDLTISHAAELHPLLTQWLAAGASVLDLAAVAECDAAGVQLLCAANRTAQSLGHGLTLRGASDAVREALRTCGLDEHLRPLPAVAA